MSRSHIRHQIRVDQHLAADDHPAAGVERSAEALWGLLGRMRVLVLPLPAAFASIMGNVANLPRYRRLEPLLDAISVVQRPLQNPSSGEETGGRVRHSHCACKC